MREAVYDATKARYEPMKTVYLRVVEDTGKDISVSRFYYHVNALEKQGVVETRMVDPAEGRSVREVRRIGKLEPESLDGLVWDTI